MLDDLIARNLANGLADFEGLHIEGSIPIKTELINTLLAELLETLTTPTTAVTALLPAAGDSLPSEEDAPETGGKKERSRSPKLDRAALQGLVRKLVRRVEVTAENGALTLHFDVQR